MLHLLPQYQKRKVINEYRIRLAVVTVFSLFFVVVMFVVFTFPTYLTLRTEKQDLINRKAGYEAIITQGSSAMGEGGADVGKAVLALKPYVNSLSPITFINAVNKAAGNVQLDAYAFTQDVSNTPVITVISGTAKSREGLRSLADSLNAVFGNVKLPLSSLARQSDIPFEFRFSMEYPKVVEYVNTKSSTSSPLTTQ